MIFRRRPLGRVPIAVLGGLLAAFLLTAGLGLLLSLPALGPASVAPSSVAPPSAGSAGDGGRVQILANAPVVDPASPLTSRAPLPVRPGLTGDPPPLRPQAGPPPLDLTLGQVGAGPVSEGAPAPLGLRAAAHLRAKPTLVFAPPSGPLDRTTGPLLTGKGMTADSGFAMSDPSKRGAQAPEPLSLPPPAYPEEALRNALEGYVDVTFSVSPEGRVVNPAVLGAEPPGVFDRAALEALSRWRYTATDEGSSTPFKVRIRFKLDDGVMERGE